MWWAVFDFLSWSWLSIWTCLLAHYLHSALVLHREPAYRRIWVRVVAWALPVVVMIVTGPLLFSHAGMMDGQCSSERQPSFLIAHVLVIGYCCVQWARISWHFRRGGRAAQYEDLWCVA